MYGGSRRRFDVSMLRYLLAFAIPAALWAQMPGLTLPTSGNNQKASVTQHIGPVQVGIDYSSPAVHGPASQSDPTVVDRRGKIWGQLVPYGLTDLGFGHRKPAPWRAGANQNTVFTVSHAVQIEGQPLAAGRYSLHMIAEKDEFTVIFNKHADEWGSFFYDASADALRVKVKPRKHEYREYLTYEFVERKPDSAVAEMQWEDLAVAWRIAVPRINEIYLSRLRQDLHNNAGFDYRAWVAASQFAMQNNTGNLDEVLAWAEYAVSGAFVGQPNFQTLSNKAQVLTKMGREAEAAKTMLVAFEHPATTSTQIHMYGRQLLNAGKKKEAMEVFQFNVKRFGEAWPTHVGMARGYLALGENAKALEHARKALEQAPDEINRKGLQSMVAQLSAEPRTN
jgi:hypothetical protein